MWPELSLNDIYKDSFVLWNASTQTPHMDKMPQLWLYVCALPSLNQPLSFVLLQSLINTLVMDSPVIYTSLTS
eukprot:c37581_g1_i1 orf=55-273(+)